MYLFKRQWEKFPDKSDDIKLIQMDPNMTFLEWRRQLCCSCAKWHIQRTDGNYLVPNPFTANHALIKENRFLRTFLFFLSFLFFYLICTQNEFTLYGWWVHTVYSSEYTVSSFRRAAIKCNRMNRIKKKNSPFGIWNLNMIHFPFHFQWWPLWLSTT